MLPLIYVAAVVPVFITSLVFGFIHLFMPTTVDPTTSAAVIGVSLLYYIVVLVSSLFVPAVRGTYGSLVAMALGALSVVIFYLTSTVYQPFNWIWGIIWLALLVFDVLSIRSFARHEQFTRQDFYNLDNLSRRSAPRW